jgi:hypothetical protein
MKLMSFSIGLGSCLLIAAVGCKADPTPYQFTDGGPDTPATKGKAVKLDFEAVSPGTTPAELVHVLGDWAVQQEEGQRVLAHTGSFEDPDFPRLLLKDVAFTNVHVKVRCSMRGGDIDRACGVLWRAKDSDNYYVTRANAREDNVNLYRVVANDRQQFASKSIGVSPNAWHTLEAIMEGAHVRIVWDGQEIMAADDTTFAKGKAGIWTKSDSNTAFDDFEATEL